MKEKNENPNVVIGLTGDVMIGRLVNEEIVKTDHRYPWGNVLSLLKSTDLNIINLETALTRSEERAFKVFNFKSSPDHVAVLSEARIDIVNLANNHILDFGPGGMIETLEVLRNAGIQYVGAGMNDVEAREPVTVFKKDMRISLLGFTDNETGWAAKVDSPGVNYLNIADTEKVKAGIEKIRNETDLLIVTIHWGPNMREEPSANFIKFAHQAVDGGADIIHGHSAHIFQGIEWYKGKLILYDTGDFVDDYRVDPVLRNDLSFLFLSEVNKNEIRGLQLIPVHISHGQVNLATGAAYEWCIRRMQQLCAPFKTKVTDNGKVPRPDPGSGPQ